MRFRLVLVVLFFLPLMVKGQTETPAVPVGVKLYSGGPMRVEYRASTDGKDPASTTLYIQGSAEFTNNSSITQKGRTEITGDFINGKDPDIADTNPNLFVGNPATKTEGVVAFIGTSNKQSIKRADRYTRVGVGAITGAVDKPAQKKTNWINFPTISVEKGFYDTRPYSGISLDPREFNYLEVDSSAAVKVNYMFLNGFNRFSIKGGYSDVNSLWLNMGQALFVNEPEYNRDDKSNATTVYEAATMHSYSQVKLDMYNPADAGFTADHEASTNDNTLRNPASPGVAGENYMTGFTPPFEEMGADYFFYHTLTKPSSSSFNSWAGNIVNPYTKLKPGVGYFMSMEVTDFDHEHISNRWQNAGMGSNSNVNRAKGGFTFNRAVMEDYLRPGNAPDDNQKGFSRFTYLSGTEDPVGSVPDPNPNPNNPIGNIDKHLLMENEKFVVSDVTVDLQAGFNFLGNPFMSPISLNYLLGLDYTDPATNTNYPEVPKMDTPVARPLFGTSIGASAVTGADTDLLRAKYWLINNATVKYDKSDGLMHFKATYDYISRNSGGTAISSGVDPNSFDPSAASKALDPENYLIAPMQMFGLQANGDFQITLSSKLRTFGMTRFQKSASGNVDLLKDYLVVEVVSPVEKTSDRTAVVMREGASLDYYRDSYDTRKGISKAMETYVERDSEGMKRAYPAPSTSIIYTKSKDGESLLGNGVPLRTKEVPLYVTPPASQQTMTLNFYNLENMVSVPNVWLIDRYENKTVKLTEGYSYNFTSGPSDLDDKENRFILRFWGEDDEVIKRDSEISVYYNTSILHISGLNQDDINSDIHIYDLQGRLIAKTKVNNAPSMEYLKPLSLGTYIVKITGKRNFTAKFVTLQN
ncbi:T9SS type A sorting domain-containing protein [Dysgonomonas reticulitermitis]